MSPGWTRHPPATLLCALPAGADQDFDFSLTHTDSHLDTTFLEAAVQARCEVRPNLHLTAGYRYLDFDDSTPCLGDGREATPAPVAAQGAAATSAPRTSSAVSRATARLPRVFESPPRGKPWVSWLLLGIWSATIFAAIPLARRIQALVSELWGRESFAYVTVAVVAAGAGLAIRQLARQRRSLASYLWLSGVAITFFGYTYRLRHSPEEALHFVQYGVLGLLAYRALSHRIRDWTIYLTAASIGAAVGVLDELIQWLTPGRFWGLLDIWIDFLGVALVQLGIAKGLRPAIISGPATATGVRWLYRWATALLLLLGASLLNTPQRIGWYAERIPALAFLETNESVMLEYGHRFVDPETGPFRSRLSRRELRRTDRERGAEVARILDRFRDHARYQEFLRTYTPVVDPFIHEARVHLFRRDRHLEWAGGGANALYPPPLHYAVAFRENRILEKYFPNTLRHSSYVLEPPLLARLEESALPDREMPAREVESTVSRRLVTSLSEAQIVALVLLAIVALKLVERHYNHPDRVEM